MRIFIDTEFTELTRRAALISIGLVAENGDLFYAELSDYDAEAVNPWVRDNVLPWLSGDLLPAAGANTEPVMLCSGNSEAVAQALRVWLQRYGGANAVEIWADVLAWDWLLFCDLFGGAFSIPEQVHYIPRDLSTLLWAQGLNPDEQRENLGEVTYTHPQLKLAKHHALYDALLEKSIFENIKQVLKK
jgi:hypothetical protein